MLRTSFTCFSCKCELLLSASKDVARNCCKIVISKQIKLIFVRRKISSSYELVLLLLCLTSYSLSTPSQSNVLLPPLSNFLLPSCLSGMPRYSLSLPPSLFFYKTSLFLSVLAWGVKRLAVSVMKLNHILSSFLSSIQRLKWILVGSLLSSLKSLCLSRFLLLIFLN